MKTNGEKNVSLFIKSDAGVTLVELLVSIALLSVIVTTFLSFFIQAARTNAMTDRVNEATFIAQEEMELLTYYSQQGTLENVFGKQNSSVDITREDGLTVIKVKETKDNLYSLRVEVKEGERSLAQMETWVLIESEE